MIKTFIILISLTYSICIYSQSKGNFYISPKALDIGVYDRTKESQNALLVFYDQEAEAEFEKVRKNDEKLQEYYPVYDYIDEDGNIAYWHEWELVAYYPELGIIIYTGGHGYVLVFDIKNKKDVPGPLVSCTYSPSGKYRMLVLDYERRSYYLQEKIDGEYGELCYVHFDRIISGYYWIDDEIIHYLGQQQKADGTIYWIGYAGCLSRI